MNATKTTLRDTRPCFGLSRHILHASPHLTERRLEMGHTHPGHSEDSWGVIPNNRHYWAWKRKDLRTTGPCVDSDIHQRLMCIRNYNKFFTTYFVDQYLAQTRDLSLRLVEQRFYLGMGGARIIWEGGGRTRSQGAAFLKLSTV